MNMEVTWVFTVRRGKILHLEAFWDYAEALGTLGLSEQDAHANS
jgi:ketosteroid isomerase-like protein